MVPAASANSRRTGQLSASISGAFGGGQRGHGQEVFVTPTGDFRGKPPPWGGVCLKNQKGVSVHTRRNGFDAGTHGWPLGARPAPAPSQSGSAARLLVTEEACLWTGRGLSSWAVAPVWRSRGRLPRVGGGWRAGGAPAFPTAASFPGDTGQPRGSGSEALLFLVGLCGCPRRSSWPGAPGLPAPAPAACRRRPCWQGWGGRV